MEICSGVSAMVELKKGYSRSITFFGGISRGVEHLSYVSRNFLVEYAIVGVVEILQSNSLAMKVHENV